MNKSRIMSALPPPTASGTDRQPKNPSQARPVWLKGFFCLSNGLCLAAFLLVGAVAAGQVGPASGGTVRPNPASLLPKASRRCARLDVTVKNPHCPACLKTLKTYLMALNGVRKVEIRGLEGRGTKVHILVQLSRSTQGPRVVDRIRAHDLEVLGIRKTN